MIKAPIFNGRRLAGLIGVGVVALGVLVLLWALSRAPEQTERLASISRLTTLVSAMPPAQAKSDYPDGAVCGSALAPAEKLLKIRVNDAAKAAGMQIVSLEVVSSPAEPLSSVQIDAQLQGPYPSGLNVLKILADQTPTVFMERLKVTDQAQQQTVWTLSGRVYCSVSLP